MEWRLRGGRGSGFDAPAGFGYEDAMQSALRRPVVAGPWLVAMAVAGSLAAGEAMRESGPSQAKGSLGRNGRPTDPLLERLVNPSQIKGGRDDSSLVNPLLAPKPNTGTVDPLLQKQWNREIEKQRNWLLENATKIADPEKPSLGREPDRMLPNGRPRLGAEAPASLRYLQAREAASNGAIRRPQGDWQDETGASASPDSAFTTLQGSERGMDRPLDTSRIVQLGGDSSSVATGRSSGPASALSALRDVANPGVPGALSPAEEVRKTLMEERTSAFATLLDSQPSVGVEGNASTTRGGEPAAGASAANPEPLAIGGIEPRRSPSSRTQQFDALLAGPETPVGGLANTAVRPNAAASLPAASRGSGLPDLVKPGGTPVASPAVKPVTRAPEERRFRGQPAILELPRFNQ